MIKLNAYYLRRRFRGDLAAEGLESQSLKFLHGALMKYKTGTDRIAAPLMEIEGVKVGHKTGSGCLQSHRIRKIIPAI